MFEAIELGQTLSKKAFKAQEEAFRVELLTLQQKLRKAKIATLVIVAGVDGAGKGEVVDQLNKWFDSRGMESHAFWDATDEELERPLSWRYWKRLPARGEIAIMFGGWYWHVINQAAAGDKDDATLDREARAINALEEMLCLDGLLIIKLWFHLSFSSFKKCMKHRREIANYVHITPIKGDVKAYYQRFLYSAERVIRHTDSVSSPWQLIESDDRYFRDFSVVGALKERINPCFLAKRNADRRTQSHNPVVAPIHAQTILDHVDLNLELDKEAYREQLEKYQQRLHQLSWQAYSAKRSTVCVFEGWDASGKGGVIRRLTTAMDARLYRVISVAAPTDEELAHHYLWRFWRQIPRAGYMRLYDRSWYGRVLVERVENIAKPHEWQRAYKEINEFEEQLVADGTLLLKFWLHITPEEQLARFEERETIAHKQHKITDDDWRNREKWGEYCEAVNEMVVRTSTGLAPWHLIAANNKFFARIEVLKTVCEALETALVGSDKASP